MKKKTKEEKIKIYYNNPVFCQICRKIIPYNGRETINYANNRKYCSQKCFHQSRKIEQSTSGIYCIENIVNNKKYIGQSKNMSHRWSEHISDLSKNIHNNLKLQNDWNKYGENNFRFYVLEKCEISLLYQKEQEWIKNTNSYYNGYNDDLGGTVGRWSEEQRKKMSITQKNIYQTEIGKKLIEISSLKKAIPIYQISLNGELLRLWYGGARQVERELGFYQSNIFNVLHKKKKSAYGYIWVFKNEYDDGLFDLDFYITKKKQMRKVYQYTIEGEYVAEYTSASSTKNNGFDGSSVLKACKNKKPYKGYMWYFEKK